MSVLLFILNLVIVEGYEQKAGCLDIGFGLGSAVKGKDEYYLILGDLKAGIGFTFAKWLSLSFKTKGHLDYITDWGTKEETLAYGFGDIDLEAAVCMPFHPFYVSICPYYSYPSGEKMGVKEHHTGYWDYKGGCLRYFTAKKQAIGCALFLSAIFGEKVPVGVNAGCGYIHYFFNKSDADKFFLSGRLSMFYGAFKPMFTFYWWRRNKRDLNDGAFYFTPGFRIGKKINFEINTPLRLSKEPSLINDTVYYVKGGWGSAPKWVIDLALGFKFYFIPEEKPTGILYGKVVDAKTGAPIPAAMIIFPELDTTAYTDETGQYRVKLPVGKVLVMCGKAGYETSEEMIVTIKKKKEKELNFALQIARAIIKGHVIDEETKSPLMAEIEIPEVKKKIKTDSLGNFTIGLKPGIYTITAKVKGYIPYVKKIEFKEGENAIEIPLKKGICVISGKIFDKETNKPLSAEITITGTNIKTKSDTLGLFKVSVPLREEPYEIVIKAPEYETYSEMITPKTEPIVMKIALTPAYKKTLVVGKIFDYCTGEPIEAEILAHPQGVKMKCTKEGFKMELKGEKTKITVTAKDYVPYEKEIELPGGVMPPLDIKLIPLGKRLPGMIVYFATLSDKVRSTEYDALNKLMEFMKEHPKLKIQIGGHTCRAEEKRDPELSLRRARSVYNWLVQKGVDASRLTVKGYGNTEPLGSELTKEGRIKNQRVDFRVIGVLP